MAAIGFILRYKQAFSLPGVDYKHLLHAHSHYAFAGWASTALYAGIVHFLQPPTHTLRFFRQLLVLHAAASLGMLLTFPFMGYAGPSVFFATLSLFISWCFAGLSFRPLLQHTIKIAAPWLLAALLLMIVSAAGTIYLAWMMYHKTLNQSLYFGAVYFYLHFQYNGWFLFGIGGLLLSTWSVAPTGEVPRAINRIFMLLLLTVVPTVFLSMLWMRIPGWMHVTGAVAAVVQLFVLYYLYYVLKNTGITKGIRWRQWDHVLGAAGLTAFSLKLVLQALSAIPQLNKYAFGIRPVVIGFLHLVLLGCITLLLLSFFIRQRYLQADRRLAGWGLGLFFGGILLNELVLMLQGARAIAQLGLPQAPLLLLAAAFCLFCGITFFFIGQYPQLPSPPHQRYNHQPQQNHHQGKQK
ncbi:MAG: hypothetical protein ACK4E8_03100 [Lacibacter sp.]